MNKRLTGHEQAIEILKSFDEDELNYQFAVSMAGTNKLGINPSCFNGRQDNPVGYYFYPASYYLNTISNGKTLPFRHHSPYIFIVRIHGRVLDIDKLDQNKFDTIVNKLKNIVEEKYNIDISNVVANTQTIKTFGKRLWRIMLDVSKLLTGKEIEHRTSKWSMTMNTLFRLLGYSVVRNLNENVIHKKLHAEEFALVPNAFTIIDMIENKGADSKLNVGDLGFRFSEVPHKHLTASKAENAYIQSVILKKPNPKLEKTIVKDGGYAVLYAIDVLAKNNTDWSTSDLKEKALQSVKIILDKAEQGAYDRHSSEGIYKRELAKKLQPNVKSFDWIEIWSKIISNPSIIGEVPERPKGAVC